MSNFHAKDVAEVPDAAHLWGTLVQASPLAWFWHTWEWHVYVLAAGETFKAQDRSFFIYEGDVPVGLCPLIIQTKEVGGKEWIEAGYYGFLPWPLTANIEAEDFAFAELEHRCREAGAGYIGVNLFSPFEEPDEMVRVERVSLAHRYIAAQVRLHDVAVEGALERVRERYARYDKKFSPLFECEVVEGANVSAEVEEEYFRLHVLDAGKQSRSRESYSRQADLARAGEAFFVRAEHKEMGKTAGMLLVSCTKDAAFDNSVAIDPAFAEFRVGHVLRLRALEELARRGAREFIMPLYSYPPSLGHIMSDKSRSISHFKEGFSRGASRAVWKIEKFLNPEYLHRYLSERERALTDFFQK